MKLKIFPVYIHTSSSLKQCEASMNTWLDERKDKIEVIKYEHQISKENGNQVLVFCHYRDFIIPYEQLK